MNNKIERVIKSLRKSQDPHGDSLSKVTRLLKKGLPQCALNCLIR